MFESYNLRQFDKGLLGFGGRDDDNDRLGIEVRRAIQDITSKMKKPYKVESRALLSRRVDNEFNNEAIEVLLPSEHGGPDSERHIGYLSELDLWNYRDSLKRLLDIFCYVEVKLVHSFRKYDQKRVKNYNDFFSNQELRSKWIESPISEKQCLEIGAEYLSTYIVLPKGVELVPAIAETLRELDEKYDLEGARHQCQALRVARALEDPGSPANKRLRQHDTVAASITEYWSGRNAHAIAPENIKFVPVQNSPRFKMRVKSGRSEIGMVSSDKVLCLKDERTRLAVSEAAVSQGIKHKKPVCDLRVPQFADIRITTEGAGLYALFAIVNSSRSKIRLIGDYDSTSHHLSLASLMYKSWVTEILARHGFKVASVDVSYTFPNNVTPIITPASQDTSDGWNAYRIVGVSPLALNVFDAAEQKHLGLFSAAESPGPDGERQLEMFTNLGDAEFDEWGYKRFQDLFLRFPDGQGRCRICSNPALSIGELSYCPLCCARASRGIWIDDGKTGQNTERAAYALSSLISEEFANQLPTQNDLSLLTALDPKVADRQMLLRFMIPRNGLSTDAGNAWRGWDEWLRLANAPTNQMSKSKNKFGSFGLATDGHVCRSDIERKIDNFLYLNGISHTVEPLYPYDEVLNTTGLRGDWLLPNGVFVEAWGLKGQERYDLKIDRKRQLAREYGIHLIEIEPTDMLNLNRIFSEFIDQSSAT